MENLGLPIAVGRTAEIYAWQLGKILKLFFDWVSTDSIQQELEVNLAIHANGLPVPEIRPEVMHVNGRRGLLFERIYGKEMWSLMAHKPWLATQFAKRMAALQMQMHAETLEIQLPSQREVLTEKIKNAKVLPGRLRQKALAVLQSLPDGKQLCHGDFHPGNILLTQKGETIIDWCDASLGNPLADAARSSIVILSAVHSEQVRSIGVRLGGTFFQRVYQREYFKLRPEGFEEYQKWLSVMAAARLSDGIPGAQNWLTRQVEKGLRD